MHTGGIFSDSVRKLPDEQNRRWREAGTDLAYIQMYRAAEIFIRTTTPVLDRYELLPEADQLVAMNGNLQLQEHLILAARSYVGYFVNSELEIPVQVIDLITRIAQLDQIVASLDSAVVLKMLHVLQNFEGVPLTEP